MSKSYLGVANAPRVLAPIGAGYIVSFVHRWSHWLQCTLLYPHAPFRTQKHTPGLLTTPLLLRREANPSTQRHPRQH